MVVDVGDGDGCVVFDLCYVDEVCKVDVDILVCFNVDFSCYFEVVGFVGKLVVFVVCLDIFEKEVVEVFYIGSNCIDSFIVICCQLLIGFECLLIVGEYIYCDVYDVGECYGKDSFLLID